MGPMGYYEYLPAGEPGETAEASTAGLLRSNGMPWEPTVISCPQSLDTLKYVDSLKYCRVRKLGSCSFTCIFILWPPLSLLEVI